MPPEDYDSDTSHGELANCETNICQNFTAARVIDDETKIQDLNSWIKQKKEPFELTRTRLQQEIPQSHFSESEFTAIAACLCANGGAKELDASKGTGYANYSFEVYPYRAKSILTQQLIAAKVGIGKPVSKQNSIEITATLPDLAREHVSDLDRLSLSIRDLVNGAVDELRIANPYFEPEQEVLEDIAHAPKRGVSTKILTREAHRKSVNRGLDQSLEHLFSITSADETELLDIRDLFSTDEDGKQKFALHAKLISVDSTKCYIGSANLTQHSLSQNFEMGVILEGDVVEKVDEIFDAVFSISKSVSSERYLR